MKKIAVSILTIFSIFSLLCCNNSNKQNANPPHEESEDEGQTHSDDTVLVSISATTDKSVYLIDEEIDLNTIYITSTYSDKSVKNVNIKEVVITGFDSSTAHENLTLTVSYQNLNCTLDISVEYPSPFKTLSADDPYVLYHDEGGFTCSLYFNINHPEVNRFSMKLVDYSTGSIDIGGGIDNSTISADYHTLSFYGADLKSKFFDVRKDEQVIFEHDKYDDSIKLYAGKSTYNLVKEEVEREYFLDPKLVGKWQLENVDDVAITIKNIDFNPEITLSENELVFTTSLVHNENGTTATLIGEDDGDFLKRGDKITFYYDMDENTMTAKKDDTIYNLEVYVDKSVVYDESYFMLANCPNGTKFINGNLTLEIKTTIGPDYRWVKIYEGDEYSKDFRWTVRNNGATLEHLFNDSNKTEGVFKYGVTYSLSAVIENDKTIVKLINDEGLSLIMERRDA